MDRIWLEQLIVMRDQLVLDIVREQYQLQPEFERYGQEGLTRAREDAGHHLDYVITALSSDSQLLFNAYVQWAHSLFFHMELPPRTLETYFDLLLNALRHQVNEGKLASDAVIHVERMILKGLENLQRPAAFSHESLGEPNPLQDELTTYTQLLVNADRHGAARLVHDLLEKDVDPRDLYKHLFHPFQIELGTLWQRNQISVAQEHFSTAATQYIMSLMYDRIIRLPKKQRSMLGTCVSGELHEMGIRMICDYMECSEWNTYYLGANMPESGVVQMVKDKNPDLVAVSCTMPVHLPRVDGLIRQLRKNGVEKPILVGGYPFNLDPDLWRSTGADGCATGFDQVVALAESLAGGE